MRQESDIQRYSGKGMMEGSAVAFRGTSTILAWRRGVERRKS